MAFLADLVVSYLYDKPKANFYLTTYHGIYGDDGLVMFKGKKSEKEVKYWLEEFQQIVNRAAGKQHLQLTTDICMTEENYPLPVKEDRVQVVTNDEFPFLDIKMSWSPEGDLEFIVFRKKGQKLKYVGKKITHKPGTLRAIPSGVLNRLAKLTSQKTPLHSEGVETYTLKEQMPSVERALHLLISRKWEIY